MERVSLCPKCSECPEVVIDGDTIRVGEDENIVVLKKDEWNVLVDAIQSGQLGRVCSRGRRWASRPRAPDASLY